MSLISLKVFCIGSIFLVHLTQVKSQLDIGDTPRVPPPEEGNASGGEGTTPAPPRGGGEGPRAGTDGSEAKAKTSPRPPARPPSGARRPPRPPPPDVELINPRAAAPAPPRGGDGQGGGSNPPPAPPGEGEQGQVGPPQSPPPPPPSPPPPPPPSPPPPPPPSPPPPPPAQGNAGAAEGDRGLFSSMNDVGAQQPFVPQLVPQSVCNLKADPGFCNLMIGRWYYDRRYHRCLPFLYTGCGGNINNFLSVRHCNQASNQCHMLGLPAIPQLHSGLSPGALNPINPLSHLAPGYILGG